jgi:glutathione S-transferase
VRRDGICAAGLFLFGAFTNADAMFAAVATRFGTNGVGPRAFGDDGQAAAYADTFLALPEMAEWTAGAKAEIKARMIA